MKHQIKKKVYLEFTLDSSEAIMFGKGGKHKANIDLENIRDYLEDCEVEVSFQLEKSEKDRFNWIVSEAQNAKEGCDESK